MQSLSFAAQVESLGAACQRHLAEQAAQRAAAVALGNKIRAGQTKARKAKATTNATTAATAETRILSVMKPGASYRYTDLHRAVGGSRSRVHEVLTKLVERQRIRKKRAGRHVEYSLP